MKLFAAETTPQFYIHEWLKEQGLAPEAVHAVDFPSRMQVRIFDGQGSSMILRYSEPGTIEARYFVNGEEFTEIAHVETTKMS